MFQCLDKVVDVPLGNAPTNKKLFNFYAMQSRPQFKIWSLKIIFGLKVGKPFEPKVFKNIDFKGYRGVNQEFFDFPLADFPLMSPYDWIVLVPLNIVAIDSLKHEPIFQFMRRMIKGFIQEVSKMDVEILKVLNRKLILEPFT